MLIQYFVIEIHQLNRGIAADILFKIDRKFKKA